MAIATKNLVEGMVQAIFGGAAGGHLEKLIAAATATSNVALAEGMVNAAPLALGVDWSDDADFIDALLTNLGVNADSAEYDAATAWAEGQLNAGTSRATLVAGAVQFLLALTDDTSDYFDLAQAFQESVDLAVEWSEGDGAGSLAIADLIAYIDGGQFTLSRGLAAKEAADGALTDAIDAFNTDNETEYTDAADVQDALDTAVADAVDAVQAIVADWDPANSAKKNAAEVAAVTVDLEEAVADAADAVKAAAAAVDPADSGTSAKAIKGIKAVVAALEIQAAAAEAADDAATATSTAEDEAAAYYAAFGIVGGTDSTTDYLAVDADGVWSVDTDAAELATAMDGETTAIVKAYLVTLQALVDAKNGQAEADAAESAADDLVAARVAVVQAYDNSYTTAGELDGDAAAYADALADLADAQDALDALPAALAAYEAAVDAADAFTTLTETADDSLAALEANGYAVVTLANTDDVIASADVDLYFTTDLEADTTAEITGFGSDGADKIYVGTDLVLGGADDKVGILEVFLDQDGDNVIVTIETETYAYSTASAADEIVITLVGVDVADLSYANGVITLG